MKTVRLSSTGEALTLTRLLGLVVPESVKKLRRHFRAKEDHYEKQRITAHLELEKRVTERITSLKKKMSEDLRQYGEEDIAIVHMTSSNASEIILCSSFVLRDEDFCLNLLTSAQC